MVVRHILRFKRAAGLLDAPQMVQWIATHECNLHCMHCMVDAGRPLKDELSADEIVDLLTHMRKLGTHILAISGGEPLMRTDLFSIIRRLKGYRISLSTNGILVPQYIDDIKELRLSVMVSLDGLQSQEKIRGVSSGETLSAIRLLKDRKVNVSVATTANPYNLDELDEIRKLVKLLGCRWAFNVLKPEGRAVDMPMTDEQTRFVYDYISKHRKEMDICAEAGYTGKRFTCGCGWTSAAIMVEGEMMACPVFSRKGMSAGNIRKKSFEEIWRNMDKFRDKPLPKECKKCSHVSRCHGGCKVMHILGAKCFSKT